jgi:hypothetical protein
MRLNAVIGHGRTWLISSRSLSKYAAKYVPALWTIVCISAVVLELGKFDGPQLGKEGVNFGAGEKGHMRSALRPSIIDTKKSTAQDAIIAEAVDDRRHYQRKISTAEKRKDMDRDN